MKKNFCKYICILPILIFVLVIILLGYNSFVNLSYTRETISEYTFMLPKEIEYTEGYNYGTLKHEKILDSLLTIYYGNYDFTKKLAQTYTFYNSNIEKISEKEEKINGHNLYLIINKLTYLDNKKSMYMFNYIYSMTDEQHFVISVECENLDDINYFVKRLKRSINSIILY